MYGLLSVAAPSLKMPRYALLSKGSYIETIQPPSMANWNTTQPSYARGTFYKNQRILHPFRQQQLNDGLTALSPLGQVNTFRIGMYRYYQLRCTESLLFSSAARFKGVNLAPKEKVGNFCFLKISRMRCSYRAKRGCSVSSPLRQHH